MKLIIPMVGFGTRMRPHTHIRPKPLITVAGKTVFEHILDSIKIPIEEIILIVGYKGEQIEKFAKEKLGDRYNFKILYDDTPRGQASTIAVAKDHIKEDCLIWFCDTISNPNLENLKGNTLFLKQVENPKRFGQVKIDQNNKLLQIKEKANPPISNLVNIGIYYIKEGPKLFKAIDELIKKDLKTKGEYYLVDAFTLMIEKGSDFYGKKVDIWEDTGKIDAMIETNRFFLNKGVCQSIEAENSVIIEPVYIEKGAKIKNSIIGPYVSIAKNVEIENSIIKDSIINNSAYIKEGKLNKSIIGEFAKITGNTKRLNISDHSEIDF